MLIKLENGTEVENLTIDLDFLSAPRDLHLTLNNLFIFLIFRVFFTISAYFFIGAEYEKWRSEFEVMEKPRGRFSSTF